MGRFNDKEQPETFLVHIGYYYLILLWDNYFEKKIQILEITKKRNFRLTNPKLRIYSRGLNFLLLKTLFYDTRSSWGRMRSNWGFFPKITYRMTHTVMSHQNESFWSSHDVNSIELDLQFHSRSLDLEWGQIKYSFKNRIFIKFLLDTCRAQNFQWDLTIIFENL